MRAAVAGVRDAADDDLVRGRVGLGRGRDRKGRRKDGEEADDGAHREFDGRWIWLSRYLGVAVQEVEEWWCIWPTLTAGEPTLL